MQWSTDVTKHAHVQEIKVPARAGNNQNYYSQIARYLDRSEKCFRFDLATHLHSKDSEVNQGDDDDDELPLGANDDHEPESEDSFFANHLAAFCPVSNYFAIADALRRGCIPTAIKLFRVFSTDTTAFRLASKPSLCLNIDEAADMFKIPDLCQVLLQFFCRLENGVPHSAPRTRNEGENCILPFERIQIWHKICIQQMQYYDSKIPDAPQTLRAIPPSTSCPHGLYDAAVINAELRSDWPRCGLNGMSPLA